MKASEVADVIALLAENPLAGVVIAGTGGCRKLRVAGKQKGKSGGFRIVTFYTGYTMPVFLLTVLSKGDRDNFSDAECNAMCKLTKAIADQYENKIVR